MRASLQDMPLELEAGQLVLRLVEWGPMAVRHAAVPGGTDMSPVLEGLPGDRCPSPHWGIVLKGSVHLRHADGDEEVTRAGDVYYWPAGHTAWTDEDAEFVEIGPLEPMRQFSRHARAKIGL
jgi:hypothetical protein